MSTDAPIAITPNQAVYLAILPHDSDCEAVRTGPISSCACIASESLRALVESGLVTLAPDGEADDAGGSRPKAANP